MLSLLSLKDLKMERFPVTVEAASPGNEYIMVYILHAFIRASDHTPRVFVWPGSFRCRDKRRRHGCCIIAASS